MTSKQNALKILAERVEKHVEYFLATLRNRDELCQLMAHGIDTGNGSADPSQWKFAQAGNLHVGFAEEIDGTDGFYQIPDCLDKLAALPPPQQSDDGEKEAVACGIKMGAIHAFLDTMTDTIPSHKGRDQDRLRGIYHDLDKAICDHIQSISPEPAADMNETVTPADSPDMRIENYLQSVSKNPRITNFLLGQIKAKLEAIEHEIAEHALANRAPNGQGLVEYYKLGHDVAYNTVKKAMKSTITTDKICAASEKMAR